MILAVEDVIDKFYILTELKRAFANGGYNAYTIGMEPECIICIRIYAGASIRY